MTRTQLLLAVVIAMVVGLGLAVLARGGGLHSTSERFRDTAAP